MVQNDLDRLVVAARRSKKLAGKRLRFSRAVEQIFFHYPSGEVKFVPTVFRGTHECNDGSAYNEYSPAQHPDRFIDALIHTHQDLAGGIDALSAFPGPRDGDVPIAYRIPNYGISSVGAWVVRPGPMLTVDLLDGVWGTQFNPVKFAEALNHGRGNAAVGLGLKCR